MENSKRSEITKKINGLLKILRKNDHLLIYYAGHGEMLEDEAEGFWLPADADPEDDTNWISNSYIKTKLKVAKANNIFLIVDSCFSGTITRGVSINKKVDDKSAVGTFLKTKTKLAMSSGGVKPVLDGGGDGLSLFARS